MPLSLRPVRVATGREEEGNLVFDDEERLVAVLAVSERGDRSSGLGAGPGAEWASWCCSEKAASAILLPTAPLASCPSGER
jgi:hypothetical protein